MEGENPTEPVGNEANKGVEVAPALIAVHPSQDSVAVAVGSDLRVFDLRNGSGVTLGDDSGHKDSIRAIRYSEDGKLFVSAGDDKLVKIRSTDSWLCISSVLSEKRVSAVAISNDGLHVCFADKFGVVWVVDLSGLDANGALVEKKAAPLLSHYCSIITSLEFSPDGQFIVSADRDFKIRVTVFPKKPLNGAHEIQSFCLGHSEFVSCLAFISSSSNAQDFLVSGSGDSTVRLWDISSGCLLDTCDVRTEAVLLQSIGSEECCSAVTHLCVILHNNLVAVAIQSLQGIVLLSCDITSHSLNVAKVVSVGVVGFIPTNLATSSYSDTLWMITGVSKLSSSDYKSLACVRILRGFKKNDSNVAEQEFVVLEDNEVLGGQKLLAKLQGSVSIEEKVFSEAAEAVKAAMGNLLIKKHYPAENREFRKRTRNDKKLKQ